MPGRGSRGRGRPPRSATPRSANFLRKPKAFGGGFVGDNSSRSSTPVSISPASTPTRNKYDKGRRDAANRGRSFIQNLFDDDDEMSRDSAGAGSLGPDSENLDNMSNLDGDSDVSYNDDDDSSSDYSVESNSTSGKRRVVFFRRPKSPDLLDDIEIPPLNLPPSSTDLLMPTEYLMQCLGIYEILRHFRTIVRLSPFTFEDFCASLLGEEQCSLYSEIHVMMVKAILREEDSNSTTFGPSDSKDSINITNFFNDAMTWPEVARAYLESDKNNSNDYQDAIAVLELPEFPFVSVSDKLKVLQTLTDIFLTTNKVREEILNEGNITYDDHCRACHKLGDLLCCETCSAVYHLTCVDPPLEEVPDDDWLCSICRAHQVKGVTECVSEAEKGGLLCRQDPLGYDRHGRKYWFLVRRIIIEGENEVWYYSTKGQIEELLEVLDRTVWERELCFILSDLRDDISRQMKITENLTREKTTNKKSAIEMEIANVEKIQSDRAKRKQEELEQKLKEEEERKARELEERKKREEQKLNGDIEEQMDTSTESVTASSQNVTTVTDSYGITTEIISTSDIGKVALTETVETTTIATTITTKTVSVSPPRDVVVKTIEPMIVGNDNKPEEQQTSREPSPNGDENSTEVKTSSNQNVDSSQQNGNINTSQAAKPTENKVIVIGSDGKQTPGIMNIQSVCPSTAKSGTTFVLLNKEGAQMKISLTPRKTESAEKIEDSKEEQENGQQIVGRTMITRSKTGSLTPKLFSDSVMGTTIKTTTSNVKSLNTSSTDEVLIINKDGEITRIARSKLASTSSIFSQQQYFKLGMDGSYKQYVNQYTTQTLALNKHQHNEERDKRRYLSHKFSLTNLSEFKWNGTTNGNKIMTVSTLRLSLAQLESSLASPFLHPNWQLHRQSWLKALHHCTKPDDFALALTILVHVIKPVLLLPVWHEALGHIRLKRITSLDREEMKKKEREQKKLTEEELARPVVWIKYTLGLKHQVWKQRGEEYRVTGGHGWGWISCTRRSNPTPQDTVGLRAAAKKLQNRKYKLLGDDNSEGENQQPAEEKPKEEIENIVKEEKDSLKEEKMETDTVDDKTEKDNTVTKTEEADENVNSETEVKQEPDSETQVKSEVKDEPMDVDDKADVVKVEDDPVKSEVTESKEEEEEKQNNEIDIENVSPKKDAKPLRIAQGNFSKANLKAYSLLTKKCDVDLIDVSKAIREHSYYPKVTKPYSRLDNLLERRLKLGEIEKKQRESIQQQLQWKLKLEAAKQEKQEVSASPEKKIIALSRPEVVNKPEPAKPRIIHYGCYSPLCQMGDVLGGQCYSVRCRYETEQEEEEDDLDVDDAGEVQMEVDEDDDEKIDDDKDSETKKEDLNKSATEDEEVDVIGDKDETNKTAAENINSNNANKPSNASKVVHVPFTKEEGVKSSSTSGVSVKTGLLSPSAKKTTTISIPGNLAQLIAQKTGKNLTYSEAQAFIRQALEKMTVEDIKAKIPPVRKITDKVHLPKITKGGFKKKSAKKTNLPPAHKFITPSGKKSLFVLERWEGRKLARKAGKIEVTGFKYECKMSNVNWPYPCPRPLFKTAFNFRLQTIKSLAAAALQLRIFWACIRWDDMATKPPAGGTNTISTETEITTTELLKRKDIGPFGLRSEFLVRKIIVPLGVPQQPKEKYTPQRSGLRERKRADSPRQTEPSVTETWVPEEVLELWEIKMFGEKVEKQRAALKEKLSSQQAQQNASQIKQQMEEQLKQQRAAMQQKRLLEAQGKTTVTTLTTASGSLLTSASAGTTTVLKGLSSLTAGGSTVLKTSGGMTTILSPGNLIKKIQQVQPKTTQGVISIPANAATGVRPMVKVQIPGSSGAITLRPATSAVTLAPKPSPTVVSTSPTSGQTLTAIKLASVANPAPAQQVIMKAATSTAQVRPATATQGASGGVQNVQIIQGPNGQLQVRGLMPGQQVIRLPDGRLQLITIPQQKVQQQATATVQTATSGIQIAKPAGTVQVPVAQTQVRPQTVLVNSSGTPVSGQPVVSGVTPTKIMVPSQGGVQSAVLVSSPQSSAGTVSVLTSGGQGIARIISPGKIAGPVIQKVATGTSVVQVNTPQGTRIIRQVTPQVVVSAQQQPNLQQKQQQLQQQQQVLAAQQAQLQQVIQQQQLKLQSGQIVQVSGVAGAVSGAAAILSSQSGQQTITVTPQQLAALQQQQQLKIVKPGDTASQPITITAGDQQPAGQSGGASFQDQFVKQLQQPEAKTVGQSPDKSPTPGSPPPVVPPSPVKSPIALSAQQKYAVTPQVVQEVVRQALMQNQTPEIQAKLLAMQKHMVQQKQDDIKSIMPAATLISQVGRQEVVRTVESQEVKNAKQKPPAILTPEQKETHARIAICNQVLKGILDKIEREERKEQKLQKKAESAEEKQKRLAATKVQQTLFKHKEALKKEIQRKRTLNERNMQLEIQAEIQEAMKTHQTSRKKVVPVRQTVVPAAMILQKRQEENVRQQNILPPMPPSSAQVAEAARAKKKKQKIISTGVREKSLNPKRKLYCVCKTPYDESRFYIGCDLCSNWYHGECVNISEQQSKYIDAFVCDDCKKQQETATEELYCLCKTPYDESRFYVGCDRCQDWFHCECVGITQKEADDLDSYICPNCQRSDQQDPINLKELTDRDYDLLYRLLRSLQSHKMGWPFLEPVDPTEVPDYYTIIKDPMDLSQVEANMDAHQYRRLSDFIKDVTKVFNNCRLYNPPDTPFFQCAEVLETFFVQRLKALKDKFLHSS
ncbi:nucleosome-remodeling factor subunit BPTF-like [Mercenaria mercenaria]|uniref:nucleosome-remodeling factor subunit BPTF-like n=1 Tax=Mercenaria mercenaria TaxID=6596 RepID=UPI00234EA1E3|nr:nucleosome-remodeling factor subunit BPTF-like [Mercenaria mercenaria]